jgi:WD40 repeat protein
MRTTRMNIPLPQRTASALFSALLLAGVCLGQTTERVSINSLGDQGNDGSSSASISANGRYVAYMSAADNLVRGDTGRATDIFVHDRHLGLTERVSVDSSGVEGKRSSSYPSISADGRFVAFGSSANNLVLGDTNGQKDVFVHDRQTHVTRRVSVDSFGAQGNNGSYYPSISADGRFVAFASSANNLVPGDTNRDADVFIHDCQTGITKRVSVDSSGVQGNNDSGSPSISADGRHVSFSSGADNLVPGDTNSAGDIFVHDCLTALTKRVSVSSPGDEANSLSANSSISDDGRYVTYYSDADNLVLGDTNGKRDVFVHDQQTGVTERASVSSSGVEAIDSSDWPTISGDGRYVAFHSSADNLVPGDTNWCRDVFIHDRQSGATGRVSTNSLGSEGTLDCWFAAISADGRHVAFQSESRNLVPGDTNRERDAFVHDRWSGLGQNSIYLTGPATAPVGAPVEFTWQATRGDSHYWLLYSQNMNGAWADGHKFDIGYPASILARGINATNGFGSHTSLPIPPRAAGYTIYFEVAARDANGVIYDSNVVGVTFQ